MHDFYSTQAFESAFTYSGNDLGAVWTKKATYFRLWAPTAKSVYVQLYRSGAYGSSDLLETIPMHYDIQGTWLARKQGNLHGIYYTYLVEVGGQRVECCDPYAHAVGTNGYRAMVIDPSTTNPDGWDLDADPNAGKPITDAVIYELHVRDLSMDKASGIVHAGKFLGIAESGTRYRGKPTGLDHMKALGITHLHLLPVFDYGFTDECREDPQFNWGYDPENFNVPEGSYASDASNGAVRVAEMKQMVKTLHDNGISVVMDVVYNHVYHTFDFCFNQIVPGYFSRITSSGSISNGSCCGNDTATERSMVRKFIVDSVNYWADEYHIDGFRFDLVGLMDTNTIREIMDTVHVKHPNVIFYGEGWNMPTTVTKSGIDLAVQANAFQLPGFSFFNDTLRDTLRGSIFDNTMPGFVSGAFIHKEVLNSCFMGNPSWAVGPSQSINYVSCHDNNTLFDRIALATPGASATDRIKMNNLAAAFTILSQGVPFLQAGEELLRTKPAKGGKFDDNSYRSPDSVNAIKWRSLSKTDVRNTLNYYKGLIAFRKTHSVLRLHTAHDVQDKIHPLPHSNPHVAQFLLDGKEENLFVVFNADPEFVSVSLPWGKWNVCIRDGKAGTTVLETVENHITVAPISTLVAVQKKGEPIVDVVAALIWEKDKFLICQRPANKARGLLWEFVGGKTEPGETMEQALIRECREELNIQVDVGPQFMQVIHEYPDILIRLTLFQCTIPHGYPEALEHNDIRWIHPNEIDEYDFCPADTDILKEIKRKYGNKTPL